MLAAILLSAQLLGGRLRRWTLSVRLGPVERLFWDQLLGLSLLTVAATALGLAGAYRPPVLVALVVAGLFADPARLRRLPSELGRAASALRPRGALEGAALAGTLSFLALSGLGALLPETFYDCLNYHLGLQAQWLFAGRIEVLPTMVQSAWPSSLDVLLAIPFAAGGVPAAKLLSWWLQVSACAGTVPLARRLGLPRRGGGPALAALCLASVPGVAFMASTTTIDHGLMLLGVAVLLAFTRLAAGAGPRWLVLGALAAGLAAGSKYTGAYLAVAVAAVLPFTRGLARLRPQLVRAAGFAALAFLVASPWYLRNLVVLGNPVYPAFDALFGPTELGSWALERLSRDRLEFAFTPFGAWRILRAELLTPELLGEGARLGWVLPAGVLALPAAFAGRAWRGLRPALAVLLVTWTIWFALEAGARYLYPVLPIAAVAAAAVLAAALATRPLVRGLVTAALVVALALGAGDALSRIRALQGGLPTASSWLVALAEPERHLDGILRHHRAGRFIDANLEPGAKLLLLGETRPLYLKRPVVYSSAYDRHALQLWMEEEQTVEGLLARLRAEGLTHLLIDGIELRRLAEQYEHLALDQRESLLLRGLLERSEPIWAEGPLGLFALPGS